VTVRRLGAGAVVAALVLVAVGALAWWQADGRARAGQPVASVAGATLDRVVTDPELETTLRRSVHLVRANGCGVERQASLSVIHGPRGEYGLTNQHVVAGTSDVVVDGSQISVGVTGRVAARDASRLDVDDLIEEGSVPLVEGARPAVGDRVVVAGYPGGRFEAMSGTVDSIELRQGYGGTSDVLVIGVQAVPGISGGIVVDAEGRAVGLVAARDPSTGEVVAYPLDELDGDITDDATPCS